MDIEEYSLEEFIGIEETEESLLQNGVYSNEQEREEYIKEKLEETLGRLPTRQRKIVTLFYGLDGNEPKTATEIGKLYDISPAAVKRCVMEAICFLRRSRKGCIRSKKLVDYLDS